MPLTSQMVQASSPGCPVSVWPIYSFFYTFIKLLSFWWKGRNTETEIFHLLAHSPKAHNNHSCQAETRNPELNLGCLAEWQELNYFSHDLLTPQSVYISKKLNQKCRQDSKPRTLVWDEGIPVMS